MSRQRRRSARWGVLVVAASLAAAVALPTAAGAVLSGTNGRIVFVSGRGQANDTTAKLYLRPTFGSTGFPGGASLVTTATGSGQHRHPTWSPDRTRIAYAQGPSAGSNFDIYILDLTDPNATPQNITNSNNVTDDRPAWSPDGTRIAFESENVDGSNQLNLKIYNVATGVTTNLTSTATDTYEHKPAWTPDSQTIFFGDGNPSTATLNDMDILFMPATGGSATQITVEGSVSEFQPSVSPDGTRICFTRGDLGDSNARVVVSLTNGGGQMVLPGNLSPAPAGYNCTWSPNGTRIAYVQGIFMAGDLVMEDSDPLAPTFLLDLETTMNRFDGNPDWAPDGRPLCPDSTVNTTVNTPVTFQVVCTDTGPTYERTNVRESRFTSPTNGTLDQEFAGDPFTYTPNQGFVGTDSFQVRSFDDAGFGTDTGTVTLRVTQKPGAGAGGSTLCAGRKPTIVGTSRADKIFGKPGADVIDAQGGNDLVKARGGNDVVCGGPGKDVLNGGPGNDKLFGQGGKDFLKGAGGRDKCAGGKAPDTASGCEIKKSI